MRERERERTRVSPIEKEIPPENPKVVRENERPRQTCEREVKESSSEAQAESEPSSRNSRQVRQEKRERGEMS